MELPHDVVKCGQHLTHTVGCVIADFRACGERFRPRALEHYEIALIRKVDDRGAKLAHHWDVQDVKRRPVERYDRGAAFGGDVNGRAPCGGRVHAFVQKRSGSISRITASSASVGAGVSASSSATRSVQPVLLSTSSTRTPGCVEARYASPSGVKRSTPIVVMTAEGPERAGRPCARRQESPEPKPGE